MTPDDFLADSVLGRRVFEVVSDTVSSFGDVEVKATKSQITFRRRRGFAYLWLPGTYLSKPHSEVVLSIALDRQLTSPRFKEISHAAPRIWQHHLEITEVDDVDNQVLEWLRAAYDSAR